MNTPKQLVNEDKLYAVIGKFFTDGNNLLLELIQNAQRAKAKHVSVTLPWKGEHPFGQDQKPEILLRIEDDGRGIRDLRALLGIAISDWDAEVSSQDPAGMGFLQLLALSKQVFIQSRLGSLLIDSQRFLRDRDYRNATLESADASGAIKTGTVIIAGMQKAWFSYMRSDMNWYRGHNGIELSINGELMEPITIETLVNEAEGRKNLCHLLSYRQNKLLIEIGPASPIVASAHSAVNWYGQMIPVYTGSGAASNWNVRFYYEVRTKTPLTPRYPDRSSLNADDRYSEFIDYVNRCTLSILRRYFDSFPSGAKFSASTNASLLSTYYEHASESELAGLDLVPVTDDAFSGYGHSVDTVTSLSRMRAEAACFHVGDLQVDDEYNLAVQGDFTKCYAVTEKVAAILRRQGIPELMEIRAKNLSDRLINLESLMLELCYADGSVSLLPVSNAMLMDAWGTACIYTEKETQVRELCDELLEEVFCPDSEWTMDDMRIDLNNRIDEQLASSFSIIDPRRFDFIPRHHDIKQISFEYGNLAVAYRDGSRRDFAIRSTV